MRNRTTKHDQLIIWLNDCLAMEIADREKLESYLVDTAYLPDIHRWLDSQANSVKSHEDRIRARIIRLDGHVSEMKSRIGLIWGKVQGVVTKTAWDRAIKECEIEYAAKCFKVASYIKIRTAAQMLKDKETKALAGELIADEEEAAEWIISNLERLVSHLVEVTENSGKGPIAPACATGTA